MATYEQLYLDGWIEQEVKLQQDLWLLISLQQGPYERILLGSKKYEFRKKFVSEACSAFVYVASPVAAICAKMQFDTPQILSVEQISQLAEKQEPGTGLLLQKYMTGLKSGYAIPVLSWQTFKPLPLAELRQNFADFHPPQMYFVLNNHPELLKLLCTRLTL